jgi:hypothetical protein
MRTLHDTDILQRILVDWKVSNDGIKDCDDIQSIGADQSLCIGGCWKVAIGNDEFITMTHAVCEQGNGMGWVWYGMAISWICRKA